MSVVCLTERLLADGQQPAVCVCVSAAFSIRPSDHRLFEEIRTRRRTLNSRSVGDDSWLLDLAAGAGRSYFDRQNDKQGASMWGGRCSDLVRVRQFASGGGKKVEAL